MIGKLVMLRIMEKERRLIIDGTILSVANVNRATTHRIRRLEGKNIG